MKNLKTTIATAIFALCCYANVNAQATEGKVKGKVVTSGDTGMVVEGAETSKPTTNAKTPPPVQDWKNKRNIHQYPGGGHAVTENKTTESDEQQPQQTAKGIRDVGVKSCGSCGLTGKVKAGGNPQATAKDTVGSVESAKTIPGIPTGGIYHPH